MTDSVIQKRKECFVCKRTDVLHCHHILHGTGQRKLSEKYGFKVWLCPEHHNMSDKGVHFNKELDLRLKCLCEEWWLNNGHTKDEWHGIFGKFFYMGDFEKLQIRSNDAPVIFETHSK